MNVNTALKLDFAAMPAPRAPKIITVASGKGGVGKTHIATNLALSLAKSGQQVLLVDADLGLANVNVILGISPEKNASHLIEGGEPLSDCVTSYESLFDVLPAGSALSRLAELDVRGQVRLTDILTRECAAYDVIVIDAGAGIGANVRLALSIADQVLVIMNPETTSLTDAYALIKVASIAEVRAEFSVVVNRVQNAAQAREMHGWLDSVSRSFLDKPIEFYGYVYRDHTVEMAMRDQNPFVRSFPECPAAQCVEALARRLVG